MISVFCYFPDFRLLERGNIRSWILYELKDHNQTMTQIQDIVSMDLMLIW